MAMTQEQEKEFNALFEMFDSDGWKLFHGEAKQQLALLKDNSWQTCGTGDLWLETRGMIKQLMAIVNYQAAIENQFDQMKKEDDGQTDI